jgi:hypothetical protein
LKRPARCSDRLIATAREVAADFPEGQLLVGVESKITENVIEIEALLNRPEIRPLSTIEMTRRWRERTGQIPGVESLQYAVDRGGPGGGRGPDHRAEPPPDRRARPRQRGPRRELADFSQRQRYRRWLHPRQAATGLQPHRGRATAWA